jgi:putative NADH-flavin reductase
MNLVLFGATGNLGSRILRETLDRGHHVTAFVRDPERLAARFPTAPTFVGDAHNGTEVEAVIRGKDAVISAMGPSGFFQGKMDNVLSTGMRNLVDGMGQVGVRRIVAVAESGILQADPRTLRMHTPGYPSFLRALAEEHRKAFDILKVANFEWTLLCPSRMVPGVRSGRYRVEPDIFPEGGKQVSLEDVAAFIVEEVEEGRFLGHRVGIAGT